VPVEQARVLAAGGQESADTEPTCWPLTFAIRIPAWVQSPPGTWFYQCTNVIGRAWLRAKRALSLALSFRIARWRREGVGMFPQPGRAVRPDLSSSAKSGGRRDRRDVIGGLPRHGLDSAREVSGRSPRGDSVMGSLLAGVGPAGLNGYQGWPRQQTVGQRAGAWSFRLLSIAPKR
jgi:hypothetical protein